MSDNDQMLEMFLFEMSSLIEQLDEILLNSEKNKALTIDDVNETFRIMHTIKGSSAMMDFTSISSVTHRLEDTFFYIRENGVPPQHFTELFDLMLEASDYLKSQLEAIEKGSEQLADNKELIDRIVVFLGIISGKGAPESAPKAAAGSAPAPSVPAQASGGVPSYHIEVLFEEDCGMENLRAFMLVNTLKESCTIIGYEPTDIETNTESSSEILINGFSITLSSDMDPDALQSIVENSMHVKSAFVTPMDSGSSADANISGDRYEIRIRFEDDCGMENLRAFMLVNTLRANCKVIGFIPVDIESNPQTAADIMQNGFSIELETAMSRDALQKQLDSSMHVRSATLTALSSAPAKPAAASANVSAASPDKIESADTDILAPTAPAARAVAGKPIKQNLINVSLSKLDELLDLMGELVITESMVIHSPDLKGIPRLDNFNKSARQLLKLTDELQDMVMSVRMIPIAGTFQKMQRIIRDMCRALNKDVNLVTMGEETDIDKTIIDGIADPIMHLVRNAMDHGIEMPDDRTAAGKISRGTITLSAQNTGGEILITVSDDGKGLDAEKLLTKAKQNGILTKPASEYTEKEAFMLLCAPGFSTKEQVTEYSGRGVGMDVVKKNIEKIGGTVVIESKKGYGMSVFLKIPLTLAIVDGMDVSVGDSLYTLQITSINESIKASKEQVIVDTMGNEMIMIRGQVFPIIRLHELYSIPDAITEIDEGILMWVESGDRSACLFVDQLIGEQQIVVKPLPPYLKRYDIKSFGISGCTILGDGNISLILDVGGIIEKVMDNR